MSLADQLGVELQAALAAQRPRRRLAGVGAWRTNWLPMAFCALLAAAAGLIVTVSQVARSIDEILATREISLAHGALSAVGPDLHDSAAVRAFAQRFAFADGRALRPGQNAESDEVAVTVAGQGGWRFAFRPQTGGRDVLARFAPTRIPFILAALALVGFLTVQYGRLTRRLERARHEAAEQARRDPLTGMLNRLGFCEALADGLACGESFSLVCLDLDGFKRINDTLGHAAGDEVLQGVARRVRAAIGDDDVACRLGGDEFAILVHGETGDVQRRIKKVLLRISEPVGLSTGHGARVGASAGIAMAWLDGESPDALLLAADQALYRAKRTGGSYCFAETGRAVSLAV